VLEINNITDVNDAPAACNKVKLEQLDALPTKVLQKGIMI